MPPIMLMHFPNRIVNKYHGLFVLIDIHDWFVRFLDLWTFIIRCYFSISVYILIWRNPDIASKILIILIRIHTYELLLTIPCSTRTRFCSPLCLIHGLYNRTMIKPILYINIVHILQADQPTYRWIPFSFKNQFRKAFKVDAMHQ